MKLIILSLAAIVCFSFIPPTLAQDSLASAEDIENVSKILTLAPGLKILDVDEFLHGETAGIYMKGYPNNNDLFATPHYMESNKIIPISHDSFLISQAIGQGQLSENIIGNIVACYNFGQGAIMICSSYWNVYSFPRIPVINAVNFQNGILTLYIAYQIDEGSRQKDQLVRITGDWKALGINVPSFADITHDGKVDAHDLLLFNNEWKKQN